jgi:catechol 2,3-dioxygenase-like lactoylglutathione lyase family enzyme
MTQSVRFYTNVLGMELLYGGEGMGFSSMRARNEQSAILNLEQAEAVTRGVGLSSRSRMWMPFGFIYERGFDPRIPRDAPSGERYFYMPDPDEHKLSSS